ncbi:cytochrome P450 85A1 isoform X1 [Cryptomeria japonica]|uniref:cytochrome P450 85A1 isoform X1 n=1 Tax=Cryptomeria japonica TaxID=3369 RepID=UPI0027DA8B49|nr:cytochrome P450 85A1 isoform X1 [Cryptomeria japonica]
MTSTWVFYLLILLLILSVFVTFKINYGVNKNLPPGNMGWIFVGQTRECLMNIHGFVQKRHNKYGKLFKTHIFGCPTVICADLEVSRSLLLSDVSRGLVPGHPKSFMDLMGKWNIIAVQHDLHRRMRGAVLSFINGDTLKGRILAQIDDFVRLNLSDLGGKIVHMHEKCRDMAFYFWARKVICLKKESEIEDLKKDYFELADGLYRVPLDLPFSRYRKSLQARKRIVVKLGEKVRERRKLPLDFHDDLLAEVLRGEINGNVKTKLSDEQILDFLVGTIFAGYDTTANTMMMTIKLLHDFPKALQDLRLEHQGIISRKSSSEERLSWEDYKSMHFTQKIIQETIRAANVVPATIRKATKDIEIQGYMIPKGWKMLLCLTETNAKTNSSENSAVFDPWKMKNGNLMAFGGGSRMCPGKDLAMLEMCVFLHHFLTRYQWEEIESNISFIVFPGIQTSKVMRIRLSDHVDNV